MLPSASFKDRELEGTLLCTEPSQLLFLKHGFHLIGLKVCNSVFLFFTIN